MKKNSIFLTVWSLILTLPTYALDYSDMIDESKDIVDGAGQAMAPFLVAIFVWTPIVFFLVAIGIIMWSYNKKQDDRKNPASALAWGALISVAVYLIFFMIFTFLLYNATDSADAYPNMVKNYFTTIFADYI